MKFRAHENKEVVRRGLKHKLGKANTYVMCPFYFRSRNFFFLRKVRDTKLQGKYIAYFIDKFQTNVFQSKRLAFY